MVSASTVSGTVEATVCPPYAEVKQSKIKRSFIKYNSLLHKKLCKLKIISIKFPRPTMQEKYSLIDSR